MKKGKVSAGLIDHEKVVTCVCEDCGKALSRGQYAVGVITFCGTEERYILGAQPSPTCCGKARDIATLFDLEEDAIAKVQEIYDHLLDHENDTNAIGLLRVFCEFHKIPLTSIRL